MPYLRTCLLSLLALPFAAAAQSDSGQSDSSSDDSGWSLGIGVAARGTLYAGEKGQKYVIPFVSYQGKHFYWEGGAAGVHLINRENFTLNAFVAARGDGLDAGDYGRAELAARGINRDLLEDRDFGADAGAAVVWRGKAGELELDARGDITNTSDGYQLSVDYRYPFAAGPVMLTPSVGVSALSAELADYYYGTLPKEVARGVVDYRPGKVTVPHIGIAAMMPLGERWTLISGLQLDMLPDDILDSPLVDEDADSVPSIFGAAVYRF